MKSPPVWFTGEFVGTFLLVFFGCGSVCASVLTGAQAGIFQVAIVWGLGIAIAIHLTRALSGAHLNPAVTVSLAVWSGFPARRVPGYVIAQLLGAMAAAAVLFIIFRDTLAAFETAQHLVRGQPGSEASAMVFGEFFPNPGGEPLTMEIRSRLPAASAFVCEFIGTAVLVLAVSGLTDDRNSLRPTGYAPMLIGLTVTLLISIFGPLTMACFNPARDLGPRLFSSLAGWGSIPFTTNEWGWLTVYIGAPLLGGIFGGGLHHLWLGPAYRGSDRGKTS